MSTSFIDDILSEIFSTKTATHPSVSFPIYSDTA